MPHERLEAVAPGLADRIAHAEAGAARQFAFGVARLACVTAELHDRIALEVASGGLTRGADVDELVRLWELERRLDAACDAGLDPDGAYPDVTQLRLLEECAQARAVAAVIAGLRPNAHLAASEAAYHAWAAGCAWEAIETLAGQLLAPRAGPRSAGR